MSVPKRQHYVPRLYLKYFADTGEIICLKNKSNNKTVRTNIRNAAVEKDFYTVPMREDKYVWENFYARDEEPKLAGVLNIINKMSSICILSKDAPIITKEEKMILSKNLINMFLRGTHTREYTKQLFDEYIGETVDVLNDNKNEENKYIIDNFNEKLQKDPDPFFKEVSYKTTVEENNERLEKLLPYIYNRMWIFYKTNGSEHFITSDNPVLMVDNSTTKPYPCLGGIGSPCVHIYFPLSPTLILHMFPISPILQGIDEYDRTIMDITDDVKFIKSVNKWQLQHCKKYVFAKEINDYNYL